MSIDVTSRLAFWRELASALQDGAGVFLAQVGESTAHSPGTPGACLFVTSGGRTEGTIGGGVMELRLIERAHQALTLGESVREIIDLHHRRDVDEGEARSGLMCAGRQTNIYCTLRGSDDAQELERWLRCLEIEQGRLRIDAAGLRVITAESDRGQVEHAEARRRLGRGSDWYFEEPAIERRRLAILGGGHCGQALAQLMRSLGWRVSVWETRLAIVERAELEGMHHVDDFAQAGARIEHARLTPVVVMTTDVANDVRALQGALAHPFPMIGAMGSAAKLEEIRRRLGILGIGAEQLARLTAPVGFQIGSETPREIAISVAGQLLAKRHEWLGDRKNGISAGENGAAESAAREINAADNHAAVMEDGS